MQVDLDAFNFHLAPRLFLMFSECGVPMQGDLAPFWAHVLWECSPTDEAAERSVLRLAASSSEHRAAMLSIIESAGGFEVHKAGSDVLRSYLEAIPIEER